MAGLGISKLTIKGYKSIRELVDLELRPLNILIGSNGAGKSNFVSFFRLLHELIEQRLQLAVAREGGADRCLHLGPKVTSQIEARSWFGASSYEFALVPTADNRLVFEKETVGFKGRLPAGYRSFGSGHAEANLVLHKDDPARRGDRPGIAHHVHGAISEWVVYHFHDTSPPALLRRPGPLNDNERLRANGENLAAFLYATRQAHPATYKSMRDAIRLAAPFFDDFKLRSTVGDSNLIQLEWSQRGSDYPFLASQLSDGTLRFMCLATALLQPSPPGTMLFDEPELGLHPFALSFLGSLLRRPLPNQVIVSTQSALLIDEFSPEDIVVVERTNGESTFRRLSAEVLREWLQDYSLGELWQKNVLGGQPQRDDAPVVSSR